MDNFDNTYKRTVIKLLMILTRDKNIKQIDVKEIPTEGANYTSKLFKVKVEEINREDLYLFAKVASMSETIRKTIINWKIYSTEQLFYNKLVKVYKMLEEESVIVEERLSVPEYHGCVSTLYKETVLLEDLEATGWKSYNRLVPINWEYAAAAVKELAKLHALSFAYSNKYPEEFIDFVNEIHYNFGEALDIIVSSGVNMALDHTRPEYRDSLKKHLKEFNITSKSFNETNRRVAIIHGDYRPSNLMHKVKKDGTVDIKIVDLQTMQGNSPVVDLLYFIFTGSDEEFRSKYYEKLLDHYYTELEAAMKRLHLDPEKIYSREDFDQELKENLPYGLTIAIFVLPIVTVDTENAPKVDDQLELTGFTTDNVSHLYKERITGIINDFVKWGILKAT